MKPSKRNLAKAAKAAERAGAKTPRLSRYAAKVEAERRAFEKMTRPRGLV